MRFMSYFKTVSPPLLFTALAYFGPGAAVFLERVLLALRCCGMAQWTHGSRRPQPGTDALVDSFAPKQGGWKFSLTGPLIYNLAQPHLLFETIDESQPQGQI